MTMMDGDVSAEEAQMDGAVATEPERDGTWLLAETGEEEREEAGRWAVSAAHDRLVVDVVIVVDVVVGDDRGPPNWRR